MDDRREPRITIETPTPGPELSSAMAEELNAGFSAVRTAVDQNAYAAALSAMEDIQAPVRAHSGPALRFLHAYLLYKAALNEPSQYRPSIDLLEELIRSDGDYVRAHPEVHYFLGRALEADYAFDRALTHLRIYVETKLVADAAAEASSDASSADASPSDP